MQYWEELKIWLYHSCTVISTHCTKKSNKLQTYRNYGKYTKPTCLVIYMCFIIIESFKFYVNCIHRDRYKKIDR